MEKIHELCWFVFFIYSVLTEDEFRFLKIKMSPVSAIFGSYFDFLRRKQKVSNDQNVQKKNPPGSKSWN